MSKPKRPSAREAKQVELDEFAEKYETWVLVYGDPVERIFAIMATSGDEDTQLKAAETLVSYRYPKLKAAETGVGGGGPSVNINIFSGQKDPKTIEVKAEPVALPAPQALLDIK